MTVFSYSLRKSVRWAMPALSKLFVGSSSSKISGFWISAEASKSRACCPPENDLTILSCGAERCTTSKTASIFGSISYAFFEKHFSKNSRTVKSNWSRGITCRAVAIERLASILTFPESGFASPVINVKSVLLPAPFCPIRANFIPCRTEKLTSSKIGFACPYSNDTSSNLIIILFWDIKRWGFKSRLYHIKFIFSSSI